MSTRCQVRVMDRGEDPDDLYDVTLYHHTDGYPEYMIPTIAKAYAYTSPHYMYPEKQDFHGWRKGPGRAGKIASYLCWADPGVFEPEPTHGLHGDIEYYYRIWAVVDPDKRRVPTPGGGREIYPRWEIEVSSPTAFGSDKLSVIDKRQPLETLLKKYQKK